MRALRALAGGFIATANAHNKATCTTLHTVVSVNCTPRTVPPLALFRQTRYKSVVQSIAKTLQKESSTSLFPLFLVLRVVGVCGSTATADNAQHSHYICHPASRHHLCTRRSYAKIVPLYNLVAEYLVRTWFKAHKF